MRLDPGRFVAATAVLSVACWGLMPTTLGTVSPPQAARARTVKDASVERAIDLRIGGGCCRLAGLVAPPAPTQYVEFASVTECLARARHGPVRQVIGAS